MSAPPALRLAPLFVIVMIVPAVEFDPAVALQELPAAFVVPQLMMVEPDVHVEVVLLGVTVMRFHVIALLSYDQTVMLGLQLAGTTEVCATASDVAVTALVGLKNSVAVAPV
jgi:hypothetical protein